MCISIFFRFLLLLGSSEYMDTLEGAFYISNCVGPVLHHNYVLISEINITFYSPGCRAAAC